MDAHPDVRDAESLKASPSSTDDVQPLTYHFDELRRRIVACVLSVLGLSCVAYFFVNPFLDWLARPVGEFVFTSPTEAFFIHMKVAFFLGATASLPVMIYQLWGFVGRALDIKERSIAFKLIPAGISLFLLGTALALFVVVPAAVKFLLGFSSPHLRPMISLNAYLSFIFWMVLGFGLFFQLPLVVIALSKIGVVRPSTLSAYRKHVFVGIVIVAAVLTPGPDVFSQLVLALPCYLLFEISLLIAHRITKSNPNRFSSTSH